MSREASVANPHAEPGFLPWVAELVRAHRQRLLASARRRGLGADDALDCVQEAFTSFLELPEARSIARSGDDSAKLLSVLVRHRAMNRLRSNARRARLVAVRALEDAPLHRTSEELLAAAEEAARMSGCILRMKSLQRRVVELCLVDEEPSGDVAAVLGITPVHARVLLHRARQHLQTCTFEETPDEPNPPPS